AAASRLQGPLGRLTVAGKENLKSEIGSLIRLQVADFRGVLPHVLPDPSREELPRKASPGPGVRCAERANRCRMLELRVAWTGGESLSRNGHQRAPLGRRRRWIRVVDGRALSHPEPPLAEGRIGQHMH